MVRFTVLASGSKGNSTVVSGGRTRILVDCGLSCRELFRRMRQAGEEPETLDAIIVTHEHSDHVNGVAVTARKLGIPVYFTEATHSAWTRWMMPRKQMTYTQWMERCRKQAAERQAGSDLQGSENETDEAGLVSGFGSPSPEVGDLSGVVQILAAAETEASAAGAVDTSATEALQTSAPPRDSSWLPAVEYFQAGQPFDIGDISVSPFTVPHDAADPVGFVFRSAGVRMAFVTDLGYISPNVQAQLQGVDLLLLESNHDLEMLRDGPYPWAVKQRVLSRVGHLSNEAAAGFLEESYDGQAAYVILAHLSESNNLPELARLAAERALNGKATQPSRQLLLARQDEPLSSVYF